MSPAGVADALEVASPGAAGGGSFVRWLLPESRVRFAGFLFMLSPVPSPAARGCAIGPHSAARLIARRAEPDEAALRNCWDPGKSHCDSSRSRAAYLPSHRG